MYRLIFFICFILNANGLEDTQGHELYEKGILILNSNTKKSEAYELFLKAANLGNEEAKLELAWGYLFGTHIKQNITYAKEIFIELAHQGHADAHAGIAFLYATGIGVDINTANALVHYHFGVNDGSFYAQMALGYRYWAKIGVAASCEQALTYYKLVAREAVKGLRFSIGLMPEFRLLDFVDNPDYGWLSKDAVEYYEVLAEAGDSKIQTILGQAYFHGSRGLPKDFKKAYYYFERLASAGNGLAMAYLGRMFFEGNEYTNINDTLAYKYFNMAAENGHGMGITGLGMMYLDGRGVPQDNAAALRHFYKAARIGWGDAYLELGLMHLNGKGVNRDLNLAHRYFRIASQTGHLLGYYNLALLQSSSVGSMKTCHTAVEIFKYVSQHGKWSQMLFDANRQYLSKRYNEAFVLYSFFAELGYETAQANTAFMIERKEGVDNGEYDNYIKAAVYWKRAAEQGYSSAHVKLGDYYYYGLGTNVDYEIAALYYRMASDRRYNAQAMFNLGYMHEQGIGVRKDTFLAKRCYDNAASASVDAAIPVALALLKINITTLISRFVDKLEQFAIISCWDIYASVILGLIAAIILLKRTPIRT